MPLSVLIASLALSQERPLSGFSAERAKAELAREIQLDHLVNPNDQLGWLKELSSRPHHVGSPGGLINAHTIRDLYRSFGWQAEIETFQVLFAKPKVRVLEGAGFRAKLAEPPIAGDTTSKPNADALPSYNCYSCDGDVTAPVVFVNYGIPADYEVLEQHGISVKGKIVIAKYGHSWRGIKPKVAAEHGAVGCIIYSDPRDDGYGSGDEYPKGGWRDKNSVQRGSVADMPVFPGDPLTPNVGATLDAKRLKLSDAPTITKIPCLPISWGDAVPILKSITGPAVPSSWSGGLPITYHFGPSKNPIHLKLQFDWKQVECRDVIAKIQGSELPDEWVIRGNHHDGWVYGADDPLSGQVAVLAEAKAIGQLVKSGWKPKRTLVYCAWDGEEPGLLGSTEWVETHLGELQKKAVAYINSDSTSRGYFNAGGSPSLQKFINEVSRDVWDPEKNMSIRERARAKKISTADAKTKKELRELGDLEVEALGSGSDFSPFLQHAGIASLDLGFGGEGEGTQYHSTYDSYDWTVRFSNPGLVYSATLARTAGRAVMRLADADSLPFEFSTYASTIDGYVQELSRLVESMRAETVELNKMLADGTLEAANDPRGGLALPKAKDPVPAVNLQPLVDAVAKLKAAVASSPKSAATIMGAERALLGEGLAKRPWYKHSIVAPGLYTGYGVKTIPGVREAIEQRNWKEADAEALAAAQSINRLADLISKG